FNAGDGKDTITETYSGSDTLQFGEGIADDQLWFTRNGNDLDIQVLGTDNLVTIKNWYLGSNYHVETFTTSNGHVLHDSQIDSLVSAMASFAPPVPGQTTLPLEYQEQLGPTPAASWS
ncbi:MAG: calcium-binding protein, partial [Rhodanobacteraceae bacterium]